MCSLSIIASIFYRGILLFQVAPLCHIVTCFERSGSSLTLGDPLIIVIFELRKFTTKFTVYSLSLLLRILSRLFNLIFSSLLLGPNVYI